MVVVVGEENACGPDAVAATLSPTKERTLERSSSFLPSTVSMLITNVHLPYLDEDHAKHLYSIRCDSENGLIESVELQPDGDIELHPLH